jgi:predicted transcriptional regulator
MPRVRTKTLAATIRLSPEVRSAWEAAASAERRSLASMFEVAMLEYVARHKISVSSDTASVPMSRPKSK